MNNNYIPVSCAFHSELELAIMHKEMLQIRLKEDKDKVLRLIPKDIVSKKGQGEFLIAFDETQQQVTLRLDSIESIQTL